MTINRLFIRLDQDTTKALAKMAGREFRDVPSQASLIIREELIRRGLLSQETPTNSYPEAPHVEVGKHGN